MFGIYFCHSNYMFDEERPNFGNSALTLSSRLPHFVDAVDMLYEKKINK